MIPRRPYPPSPAAPPPDARAWVLLALAVLAAVGTLLYIFGRA